MNIKKLAVGFAIFFGYYLVSRILENKVGLVRKITTLGA